MRIGFLPQLIFNKSFAPSKARSPRTIPVPPRDTFISSKDNGSDHPKIHTDIRHILSKEIIDSSWPKGRKLKNGRTFTPDDYFAMSSKQIKAVKSAFPEYRTIAEHQLEYGLKLKDFLEDKYKDQPFVFVSVGRSPDALARVLEYTGIETKYLPISNLKYHDSYRSFMKAHKYDTYYYQSVLKNKGLTPKAMQESGKKYLFYDYSFSGKSYMIFKQLMLDEFNLPKDAVEFNILNDDLAEAINSKGKTECGLSPQEFLFTYMQSQNTEKIAKTPELRAENFRHARSVMSGPEPIKSSIYSFWLIDMLYNSGQLNYITEKRR